MASPLNRNFWRYRTALFINLCVIIPLGYIIRFSQGPAPEWLNDACGSIAYEIFWILFVMLLFPRLSLSRTAIAVFLATCGVEFLQLWHPPLLQAARATLVGRLVLGNTFSWADFPAYVVGSSLGWVWVRYLRLIFAISLHDRKPKPS